ncbi:translesion error-prone DNA polymerase V autoproteolytic subunit [Candidatus Dependentiae bacterium]|nr:translesion error-prone DNA polymerase V autoproteolytic subunit [Candidatus Dependentiae bacterium]
MDNKCEILFIESSVCAGFPSPGEDYTQGPLNLNELLIKHPAATFFVRVKGDSMTGAGIHSGDIVIVDRALSAVHNKIVIARVQGELTLKRLKIEGEAVWLCPENAAFQPMKISSSTDFEIWGVVTCVIHQV